MENNQCHSKLKLFNTKETITRLEVSTPFAIISTEQIC